MIAGPPAVRLEGLTVRYGASAALEEVVFSVEPGDYVAVVGPNGSGKTTLLRAVAGLLTPHAGRVEVFGRPPSEARRGGRIGWLPQGFALPLPRFPATVEEIVATGRLGRGPASYRAADRAAIAEALAAVGLEPMRRRPVGSLSGGQLQRALLARLLAGEPELLLLDEPTTALDPLFRNDFHALIERWNRERGATVLLVTHDAGDVGRIARRLLYLDRRVVFYGSFEEFCRSEEMTRRFGAVQQHLMCRRHEAARGDVR